MVSLSFSLSHFLTLSSHSQSLLFNHWVGLTSVGGSLASRQSQLLPAGMSLKIAATVWVAVSPPLPSHSLVFLPSAESVGAESPEAPTMVPCQPALVPCPVPETDRSKPAQHFMQKCLGIPVLGDVSISFQMPKLGKSNNQKFIWQQYVFNRIESLILFDAIRPSMLAGKDLASKAIFFA